MDRTTRTVDDYLTDDQTDSPTETMEIERTMGKSIVKAELGEIMEIFLARRLEKFGTSLKVILSVDLNPFNQEIRHLEDQMVTGPLVPPLTNKNFPKAIIKHQQTWFVSPTLMIALTYYQNFVR